MTCSRICNLEFTLRTANRGRSVGFVIGVVLLSALRGMCAERPSPARRVAVPVALPLATTVVDAVVVSGARRRQRQRDAVVRVRVVSRRAIVASGADDVAELLAEAPGLRVSRSFRGAEVRSQGLSPRHTLVLVDGFRLVGRIDGVMDLSRFDTRRIARVEVVPGASSALYGSDALGGVINLVTRRPTPGLHVEGSAQWGAIGSVDASAHVAYAVGPWSMQLSGGWHRNDAWDLDTRDRSTSGPARSSGDLGLRLAWRKDATREVALLVDVQNVATKALEARGPVALFDRRSATDIGGVGVQVVTPLFGGSVQAGARVSAMRHQFLYDQRGGAAEDSYENARETLATATTQWHRTLPGGHGLAVGVDGLGESLTSNRTSEDRVERGRIAVFAQDDWRVRSDGALAFQGGVRAVMDSAFGSALAPNLGVRWSPRPALALRLGVGTGFRAPDAKERFLRFENGSAGYVVKGNPDLDPERSTSIQASVIWRPLRRPGSLGLRRWSAGLDAHITWVRDLVTTQSEGVVGTSQIYSYRNIDQARTQGTVTWVRWRARRLVTAQLAWTWLDAMDLARDRPLQGRAPHALSFSLRARAPVTRTRLVARIAAWHSRPRYEDRDGDGQEERHSSPGYTQIDLRIEQAFGSRFVAHIGLDNALDAGAEPDLLLKPRLWMIGVRARL